MIAELHIQTKLRDGITQLKWAYCTPPFKVADIREDKRNNPLHLMLMSSSPGILDGDAYRMKVDIDEGCALRLSTQSYQRLFKMKVGATQHFDAYLQPHSSFSYIPHPTVPHECSSFVSRNRIYLSDNCRLIWGEVLTCGRMLKGETFLFSKYHNITEIFLNSKLIIKENLLMEPASIDVNAIGQLEDHTHQATLIYFDGTADVKQLKQNTDEFLSSQAHITYGITETHMNGLLVRILGFKAEQLHQCLLNISHIVQLAKLDVHVQ